MSFTSSSRRAQRRRRPADASASTSSTPSTQTNPASPTALRAPSALEVPSAAPASAASFAGLGVPAPLIASLAAEGIDAPFPIQAATLPDSLAGRDVLGRGRTGSGKTLAFALPLVARLQGGERLPRRPRGLVLVPTRELANQVLAVIDPLARRSGLRASVIFGGVGQSPQVEALRRGVDIIVACPGRLEDLIGQGFCTLGDVELTVIDEADHMADLGFLPGVRRLLDRTPRDGQRLLFSATLDNGVDVLIKRYLQNPVTHSVDPVAASAPAMDHHVFTVAHADKAAVVQELAGGMERSVLFMRTKHTAKRLARQLTAAGIPAVELHGNLSQGARERNLAAFSEGSTRVLVATDIAARGIHVDEVALVVHVDPPAEHKAYLHRSGRTARAGASGSVVTLALPEQMADVRTLTKQAGIRPTTVEVRPGASQITALAGPQAPRVSPPAVPVVTPGAPNSAGPSSGRGGVGAGGGRARARSAGQGTRSHSPAPAGKARSTGGAAGSPAKNATGAGSRREGASASRAGTPGTQASSGQRRGQGGAGRGHHSRSGAPTAR
jgi:superfamily II DNA/RNA helicase